MRPHSFRAHHRQYRLGAEEDGFQIDGNGAVEIGFGEVVDAPDNGDAGVVDENVDRPELGVGAFDHLRDRARFRDIRADRHRLAACAG